MIVIVLQKREGSPSFQKFRVVPKHPGLRDFVAEKLQVFGAKSESKTSVLNRFVDLCRLAEEIQART